MHCRRSKTASPSAWQAAAWQDRQHWHRVPEVADSNARGKTSCGHTGTAACWPSPRGTSLCVTLKASPLPQSLCARLCASFFKLYLFLALGKMHAVFKKILNVCLQNLLPVANKKEHLKLCRAVLRSLFNVFNGTK